MGPFWQWCMTIGAWTQTHQTGVLTLGVTLLVVLGLARLTWRTAFYLRRPWR
jgi:hypothetical protein